MSDGLQAPVSGDPTLLAVKNLDRSYEIGGHRIEVLKGLELTVARQDTIAVVGASGVGKSTLLHILGALDHPTGGEVLFEGRNIFHLSHQELARFRNRKIGFVFQGFNLLARTSALENVELPMLYTRQRLTGRERHEHALRALETVGLAERADHHPNQLSGGQQQRVAIARALITDPTIIVADEPTGDLDRVTAEEILGLLERLNDDIGKTIIMVTHDPHASARASRTVYLNKGQLSPEPLQ